MLRSYRGSNPQPFMSTINSLSFSGQNMDLPIVKLHRDVPGGFVEVTRIKALNLEIVRVKSGTLSQDIIILILREGSGMVGVRIYDARGAFIKEIRTPGAGDYGFLCSADVESFHIYDNNIRRYSKWSYQGAKIFEVTFASERIYHAQGFNEYDLIFDAAQSGSQTQTLFLYKNLEYVGSAVFSGFPDYVTGAVITAAGIYLGVYDGNTSRASIIKYDFTMAAVAQSAAMLSYGAQLFGNDDFIASLQWRIEPFVYLLTPSVEAIGTFEITRPSGGNYWWVNGLGLLGQNYLTWQQMDYTNRTITIVARGLPAGDETSRFFINEKEQLDLYYGLVVEQARL